MGKVELFSVRIIKLSNLDNFFSFLFKKIFISIEGFLLNLFLEMFF